MTEPFAWLLTGLALLSGLQETSPQEAPARSPRAQGRGKRPERVESLVKLPDDYVRFARVPYGGLWPRLATRDGTNIVLFYKGEATHGSLSLTRSSDEAASFSPPVAVEPEPGRVAAWNGMPSSSLDVGPDGRARVAWITPDEVPSLRFASETPEGGFGPAQDLGSPPGLGSVTAVAVDSGGRVHVFFVAQGPWFENEEAQRPRIWSRSSANGSSFDPPELVDDGREGASEHSSIAANVDDVSGAFYVIYRTADPLKRLKHDTPTFTRDMRLLASMDGHDFDPSRMEVEKRLEDPGSGAQLFQWLTTTMAIWEGNGNVSCAPIRRAVNKIDNPMSPRDDERASWRTHAAGAATQSEVILAWLERPRRDRQAAPSLAWQVWFRETSAPLGAGRAPEPPGPSGPVVFPRKQGGFTVLY